jgi:hypothetical protein
MNAPQVVCSRESQRLIASIESDISSFMSSLLRLFSARIPILLWDSFQQRCDPRGRWSTAQHGAVLNFDVLLLFVHPMRLNEFDLSCEA